MRTVIPDITHHRLSASSAHRWMICAYSATVPSESGSSWYAAQGTVAHYIGELCIRFGQPAYRYAGEEYVEGEHTIIVDDDMVEAVQQYIDFVHFVADPDRVAAGQVLINLEMPLELAKYHPDLGGTSDLVIYDRASQYLLVTDYKHGSGIVVDPERNPQMMIYALGALEALKQPAKTIDIVIVQPRAPGDTLKRWTTNPKELRAWGEDLRKAAAKVDEAPGRVAGGHCRFCPALGSCDAQRQLVATTASTSMVNPDFPPPAQLTVEQKSRVLEFAPLFGAWVKAVQATAQSEMEAGVEYPGFKLVKKRAVRKWADEEAARENLEALLEEDAYEKKLLTVAKAEKALKAVGKKPAAIAELWHKPDNGVVVAPEGDKRTAVAMSDVFEPYFD